MLSLFAVLPVLSYKLRYIVGFGLVEMAVWTRPKPTIYRNLYYNTGPDSICTLGLTENNKSQTNVVSMLAHRL